MTKLIRRIFKKQNLNGTFVCKIKNCENKKKNGRCSLKEIIFYKDETCKYFIMKESKISNNVNDINMWKDTE